MLSDYWQWAGCLTGILGAGLLAIRVKWSGWAFVAYLTSNLCWIVFGIQTKAAGLVVMQIAFTITSLIGIWRWLILPHRLNSVNDSSSKEQHGNI